MESITTPVRFSIEDFVAHPLEMFSLCQNFQERLVTNPKAKAYGLKAMCVENSDATISVTLLDHAVSVSNEHANQVLNELAKGEINGPWEFTITELER